MTNYTSQIYYMGLFKRTGWHTSNICWAKGAILVYFLHIIFLKVFSPQELYTEQEKVRHQRFL